MSSLSLIGPPSSMFERLEFNFLLTTDSVVQGTRFPYIITGVDQSRIVQPLIGQVTIFDNQATVSISVRENFVFDDNELLTITFPTLGLSESVYINDATIPGSQTPVPSPTPAPVPIAPTPAPVPVPVTISGPSARGNVITNEDYNRIQRNIAELLLPGIDRYGLTSINSQQRNVGQVITRDSWVNLTNDINAALEHQTNQRIPQSIITGQPITANQFNYVFNTSTFVTAQENRYRVHPQQLSPETRINRSVSTSGWTESISHSVLATWPGNFMANHFFNLGGEIRFKIEHLDNAAGPEDNLWKDIINSAQEYRYTRNDFVTWNSTSTTIASGVGGFSYAKYLINAERVNNGVRFDVLLINDSIDLVVTPLNAIWQVQEGVFGPVSPTPVPTPSIPPSTSGSFLGIDNGVVSTLTFLVDNQSAIWTLENGAVKRNGTNAGSTPGAVTVLWYNSLMYYKNSQNNWFLWVPQFNPPWNIITNTSDPRL
jgi:hypothetical protein